MSALLDQKYAKLFFLLDSDGDGVIAEDDFELMAERVVIAFGEQDTVRGEEYAERMAHYWRALRAAADTDGEGQVDEGEFGRALRRVSDDFDTLVAPLYEAGFRLADRDGDGLVAKRDFGTFMVAVGVPEDAAYTAFDALADAEGRLSRAALMAAAAEYYRGAEPSAGAGHLLFGAL
ncbi:calcium-binding protein [Streptomyces sp. NPDC047002]|uniref:EF-hand domain-containing protein n=1 Tax=Streptomyces sp. NPDC047002 TaxID=3155475 RepID=UPI0034570F7F